MASGGSRSKRGAQSEPKKRTSTLRLDSEERSSIGSSRQEDRPNNWEFSDWQPSLAYDSGKRIKKGNEEKERERGQSHDGSSHGGDRTKPKTPSTFPRTKMTTTTPLAERLALQNLRQHLTFSDNEEIPQGADGGEKNNERYMPRRKERPTNYVAQDTSSTTRNEMLASGGGDNNRDNRNKNKEDGATEPDSTQIVSRLMQIRDYIKQATSMMDGLKRSTDHGDLGRARQLDQVVQRLKEQEQKYLDLLLRLSAKGPQLERLNSLLNHLQEQEYTYVGYLKTLLGVTDFDELLRASSVSSANINDDTESEAVSVDLDVASDTTSNTTDDNEEQDVNRPVIEDHLGRHSDTEADEPLSARSSKTDSELEHTLVNSLSFQQQLQPSADQTNTPSTQLVETRKRLETDLVKKNDELEALRQQHDLLKKMLNQQEQLRALQGRQEALLAIQRDAEDRLREEKGGKNEAAAVESSTAAIAAVGSANAEISSVATSTTDVGAVGEDMPKELKDLRQRLNYLKNIYDIKDSASGQSDDIAESEDASVGGSVMSVHRHHLEDKLHELQDKRYQMEDLMKELKELRREQKHHLNQVQLHNELDGASTTSSQVHMFDGVIASTTAEHTAKDAGEVLQMLETRKKLKKLEDVRGRLNQLRDLVQYYQSGTDFIHGDDEQSSLPAYEDYYGSVSSNLRDVKPRDTVANRLNRYAEGDTSQDTSRQPSEVGSVQDNTDTESQSSSLAAWGDDPEVQDKVKKLKMAKEKLRRLQDLVSMVQQSPDVAQALPDDLAALAAGFDSDILSELADIEAPQPRRSPAAARSNQPQQTRIQPPAAAGAAGGSNLASPSVAMSSEQREVFYKHRMQEQRVELEQLVDERRKLLAIQDQLQRLHDQLPGTQSQQDDSNDENEDDTNAESEQSDDNSTQLKGVNEGAQVTFQEPLATVASYDELYGKMRQHRMLREELREKKKELEYMMKKDRPRKQYFRNQDNQSDNISFSNKSDPFGTQSGDMTVATWGGSTADNMESIEEDENDSGDGQEADDGFPVDGILQVEEEEEEVDNDDSDSDERNTYTVEGEFDRDNDGRRMAGNRRSTGAPLMNQHGARGRGRYQYNYWSPDNGNVLNNARTSKARPPTRRKQQNLQAPDELMEGAVGGHNNTQEELKRLRQQLQDTRAQLQGFQAYGTNGNPAVMNQMNAQLQQQQLLLYQQMLSQQQENADRLRRLELTVLRSDQTDIQMNPYHLSPYSQSPLLQPLSVAPNTLLSTGRPDPNSLLATAGGRNTDTAPSIRPFQFQPRAFTGVNTNSSAGSAYSGLADVPQQLLSNNLYSTGSSTNNRDPALNEAAQNITVTVNNTATSAERLVQQRQLAAKAAAAARSNLNAQADRSHMYRVEDVVPIETIQASDQRVPPLNLNRMMANSRHRAQESRQNEYGLQRDLRRQDIPEKKTSTPSRANAASNLASRQFGTIGTMFRPGLSAGISGTAGGYDTVSLSSYVSSVPGGEAAATDTASISSAMRHQINIMESHEPRSEFSLFETLRETIYSEVATLISQNENRPHFLIELFRELQMLNNDYLRQRALYAVQDLVTRHLTDDDNADKRQMELSTGTELTPSEGILTSDDEQVKAQSHTRNPRRDRFDYAEQVDTVSTLSTPNSTTENPFSKESLGDTVIHLDKALHRMREYERRLVEAQGETGDTHGASPVGLQRGGRGKISDATSSSAQDQGSEDSVSDVPDNSSVSEIGGYPRIDTQELDRQIKSVMTEVIPVLKEHMNDHCSQQLLQYIRRLVLSLTKHRDDSHEFVRFFHKQLESILHDSLAKFEGRKMRDCSEDLLVELSEILFNELAFFRLMQDLDGPKKRSKQQLREWRQDSESQDTAADDEPMRPARMVNMLTSESEFVTESESDMSEVQHTARRVVPPSREEEFEEVIDVVSEDGLEDDDDDDAAEDSDDERSEDSDDEQDEEVDEEKGAARNEEEQEELGKDRDDELANQTEIKDDADSDVHANKPPMKFELAQSELKSFNRIGSDEDDEGAEDEAISNEDPSETAVSRDARNESAEQPAAAEAENSAETKIENDDDATADATTTDDATADATTGAGAAEEKEEDTQQPVTNNVNGQINGHDENGDVTLDDLPTKMVGLTKDELGNVAKQMAAESQQNNLTEEVISGINSDLAGDENALKDPGESSERSDTTDDDGDDEEDDEEDQNVLYLTTPEGGPLIVAALENSETEV